MKQPNIIFVFSDQQRWDTVGCYGGAPGITPNLNRMAAEGVRFEHAFTCQPVCGPARACLQTGKYAAAIGCHANHRRLPPDESTIAMALSGNGYETGYLGKWHLASCGPRNGRDDFRTRAVPPDRRGGYRDFWLAADVLESTSHAYDGYMFDAGMNRRDFPAGRYRADVQTDWAIEYLRSRDSAKPFFLFVSYIEPHHQNDHHHFEGPHGSRERFKDFKVPGDLAGTEGDWRGEYPDYLGCVHSLDHNLGRLRATLDGLGMASDTLVIYTSDHGSHFRTRNREYKRSCHDGCIRIPMIACGPGFKGGMTVPELVSLIDIPPTIIRAGGLDVPAAMRGRPLQDLAAGNSSDWPREVFLQISESHVGRAVRTAKWKYSVCAPGKDGTQDAGSDVYAEDFLYDLQADPHERNNLVRDTRYTAVRSELARTLARRMTEAGETAPVILPAR